MNAPRVKRDIYMVSAFLTALAGTFYTQYIYFIDPATAFNFSVSIEAALVSIVGGVGTLWGPVIGTALLESTSALAAKLAGQFDRRRAVNRVQHDPDGRDSCGGRPGSWASLPRPTKIASARMAGP